ncbi:UDP-N-acetylmuramoylalanyl-D-glutamyl-2,6-diaminopimelate--D-alanyl-D-alanine ligase [Parvibaculum sp.]|uniref:UDP-N-acetylmuramoylalanyl-D-glutamyl-2, 6-diaminopimelate--D-alanyl-D-alanine ligase n=1 Tax=Parvibaculum sp. TaxID=2024848 RepID=UPI002C5924D7|nr:UDP-N-acetylmuramoylalanyl-D-glutamyl-2,6-diaminopimelate--D-alanyl-D-alanine ligase [Parvibaculum sp.]HUD51935.1 UDP-N-acetylmuramoylalanyl-D-glutamyl-2,6-diaminopimelate--D-alanyl-D-alanine ligase [Parvibaculum sp.]
MKPLWTRAEVLAATGGTSEGADWTANGVSIDSRSLEKGDLFVAIKGENTDGHVYVAKAFERGAAAALVSDVTDAMRAAGPLVIVPDALEGLNALGRTARRRAGAKVVAVTGSVGKTGTKEALRMVLSEQGPTHASAASYNNLWGVPLSLARMPADTRFGIFEIGMNHSGEITPLSKLVEPFVALITTVEAVHMAYFNSVEEIADAKAEIFDGLQKGGVAILNRDNPHFARLEARAKAAGAGRIISFGEHSEADAHLEKVVLKETCSCVSATICGTPITYKLGVPGRHIVQNSLAMLACVHALDADLALAALALAHLEAPKGRGERHRVDAPGRPFTVIDESYNANPASMRASIEALGQTEPGARARRIAVLGDMLELGPEAIALHREVAVPLARADIDLVFACGPHMRELYLALPEDRRGVYAETSDGLIAPLVDAIQMGDVVMVKGSNGSRMRPIVDALLALGDDDSESIRRNRGEA